MNRKEASFILANIDRRVCDDELNEALDMAIKALEQEPCEDMTTAYLMGYYADKEHCPHEANIAQEPCGDAIDRAEAIKIASGYCHPTNVAKELAKLPSVNPQPCEDAISRQAVTDTTICDGISCDECSFNTCEDGQAGCLLKERVDKLPSVNPTKTGHCKDCKWWKDSDGTYCRGIHAESKCPINRKEVYEGNGYCYMFEPQERNSEE